MSELTVREAIAAVLRDSDQALSPFEIHRRIKDRDLYPFDTQDELNVVRTALNRHCVGKTIESARSIRYFSVNDDGMWSLLAEPVRERAGLYRVDQPSPSVVEVVSVPSDEDECEDVQSAIGSPGHYEIQRRLLMLGSRMGLRVWCPKSDRGKTYNDETLGSVPNILDSLPSQFDPATNKTIENIDVLWLDRDAFVAGFEVEHTTSIYSGLLRMSDLVAMQPNITIDLYLVAPDERYAKFKREVARPTFTRSFRRPLYSMCKFLPYSKLTDSLAKTEGFIEYLKPDFLSKVAIQYDPASEFESSE